MIIKFANLKTRFYTCKKHSKHMKIIFFGSPELSCKSLEALHLDKEIDIQLVITQPDKAVGRKQKLTPVPVKQKALNLGIEVFSPHSSSELEEKLSKYTTDFFVVIAYGMIFPKNILQMPKIDCINVHFSLLPKYRGASPIQQAILNGDEYAGISIMKMAEKMDAGAVYKQEKIKLEDQNLSTLGTEMSDLSAKILAKTLKDIEQKKIASKAQDESKATYCKKIQKQDGEINWNNPAKTILQKIRAYYGWPSATAEIFGIITKIHEATNSSEKIDPGKTVIKDKQLLIGTATTAISITSLQPSGKKRMAIESFINGIKI